MRGAEPERYAVTSEQPLIVEEDTAPDWRSRARISKDRYFSRDELRRERAWFDAGWVFVGSTSQIEAVGDFLTVQLIDEPILVVNGEDGVIRAFYNVCSHRGRRLVDAAKGNAPRFRCVFHEWTYGLDGALRGVPHGTSFTDLDRSRCGLKPVRLEQWNGLLFVNLDGQAEPLSGYLGPMKQCLAGWIDAARVCAFHTIELRCNWKLVLDNFYEFYHLDGLHPQRRDKLVPEQGAFALFERHALQVNPYASDRNWDQSRSRSWQDWLDVPHTRACGFSFHLSLFPNTSVHINPGFGGTSVIQALPHPDDPERSSVNMWGLTLGDEPFDPSIRDQGTQDFQNCPPHVAGLRSRSFSEQIMSSYECRVSHFHAALDRFLTQR